MRALIVIDIQKEYITPGRAFYIQSIQPSLMQAQSVLQWARGVKIPVIHVQHHQPGGAIFNPNEEYSQFVKGFEPLRDETVVTKGDYSCFSSSEFEAELERLGAKTLIIIGYGSSKCCLATTVEGYHRGFKIQFVQDATAAKAGVFDEASTHAHMVDALRAFAEVVRTEDLTRN